ncbi:MAG: hypothetical protein J2P37_10905 [Ktedonobacteraceae bacterium]|nr:hypothetical protein [Ktedonobacteraceae bacterium]
MTSILVLLGFFIGLALTSQRWGADSTDKIDSPEWERRRSWNMRLYASTEIRPQARHHSPRSNGHLPHARYQLNSLL